jgi:hypothetical protein
VLVLVSPKPRSCQAPRCCRVWGVQIREQSITTDVVYTNRGVDLSKGSEESRKSSPAIPKLANTELGMCAPVPNQGVGRDHGMSMFWHTHPL